MKYTILADEAFWEPHREVNIRRAKKQLSRLLKLVASGEEVVITGGAGPWPG